MSKIFENMRLALGLSLNENETYNRAFEMGVLMKDFTRAAELFHEATHKGLEKGNAALVTRATANALLYRYLAGGDSTLLKQLVEALRPLPLIECIGLQQKFMPTEPLCAELDCRMVEALIEQAPDDALRLRDLHKLASSKFQALTPQPLITYEYVKSAPGYDGSANELHFFHQGMYQFYEAMSIKDRDPAAAADDLALAVQAFRRCNHQIWTQKVVTLLESWRLSRTCWLCHREMQGYELHFSMCRAVVTPYTEHLLEVLNQDHSAVNLASKKIAVCTPCGSMISFKATEEAEKVRLELNTRLNSAFSRIAALETQISRLQLHS